MMGYRWSLTRGVGRDVVINILMISDDVLMMMDDDSSRIEMQQLRRTCDNTESKCIFDPTKATGCSWPSLYAYILAGRLVK